MMNEFNRSKQIAHKDLIVNIGEVACQADGSVMVQYGDTSILATAVMSDTPSSSDYLPLFVDYQEKFYAAGKIKGSRFIKREGRPSEESVLTGRLIDRAIRPFFDERIRNEIQVIITVLSLDEEVDPDIPALFGASLALMISDIPWDGPVGALRVGRREGQSIVAPSFQDREQGDFDGLVTLNAEGRIVMMESEARMVPESEAVSLLEEARQPIQDMIDFQQEIVSEIGQSKRGISLAEDNEQVVKEIHEFLEGKLEPVLFGDKHSTKEARSAVLLELKNQFPDHYQLGEKCLKEQLGVLLKQSLLQENKRPDGRSLDEIRSLSAKIDFVPRMHGSALFNRGDTQSLSVLTLGGPGEAQIVDEMEEEYTKHFMHHYNFPPYCVGDTKPLRGPGRREIGHGALAEKALAPAVPDKSQFPYTIRLVTEILGSNGSSSMASVCSSTLAMLAGGIPLKEPVAGIAMGIVEDDETGDYRILTDIQGPEDFYGEMDFKVAGTQTGLTAIQMDVKGSGMNFDMLEEALEKSKDARLVILDTMNTIIDSPRSDVSEYAPQIMTLTVDPEKIGEIIGPSGKTINAIIEATEVKIDIEDDGSVFITGGKDSNMTRAQEWIRELVYEPQVGEVITGKVVKIVPFGAFIRLAGQTEGLLHVSEVADHYVEKVEAVLEEGQDIEVKVKAITDEGKINLTRA